MFYESFQSIDLSKDYATRRLNMKPTNCFHLRDDVFLSAKQRSNLARLTGNIPTLDARIVDLIDKISV